MNNIYALAERDAVHNKHSLQLDRHDYYNATKYILTSRGSATNNDRLPSVRVMIRYNATIATISEN